MWAYDYVSFNFLILHFNHHHYFNELRESQQKKAMHDYKNFKYKTIDEINEIYY
jgi:hypothetical protein